VTQIFQANICLKKRSHTITEKHIYGTLGPLFSVVDFGLKEYRIAGYFRGVFIFVYFHGQTEIAKINSAKYLYKICTSNLDLM
jgi:hypothetical protein